MKIEIIQAELLKAKEIFKKIYPEITRDSALQSYVSDAKNAIQDALDEANIEMDKAKAVNGKMKSEND